MNVVDEATSPFDESSDGGLVASSTTPEFDFDAPLPGSSLFQPSPFLSHPLIRGGHLQTVCASLATGPKQRSENGSQGTELFEIPVSDGDRIALHLDRPESVNTSGIGSAVGSILLIHGLTGCHAASYMIRLAKRFLDQGYRTYRMDMRGFGRAREWSCNLSHAGRSDDVAAALAAIHDQNPGEPISAIGISLGGAQLLRGVARIDGGLDEQPDWRKDLHGIAAISPPIDLLRCSENMQQRSRKLYNRYFIHNLIKRLPPGVVRRSDFQQLNQASRPRTLWELDDQFTAPLSGFENARKYYERSSACDVIGQLSVPTLILAAADDPIVPIDCFQKIESELSDSTTLLTPSSGGHVGFVGPNRRCWIDDVTSGWFSAKGRQKM